MNKTQGYKYNRQRIKKKKLRQTLQSLLEAIKKMKQSFGGGQTGLHSQQSGGKKETGEFGIFK